MNRDEVAAVNIFCRFWAVVLGVPLGRWDRSVEIGRNPAPRPREEQTGWMKMFNDFFVLQEITQWEVRE